jgi:hypothetical protein
VSLLTVVLVVFWIVAGISSLIYRRFNPRAPIEFTGRRDLWRMPPVALLERPTWKRTRRLAMYLMGAYLVASIALLFVRAVVLATGGH